MTEGTNLYNQRKELLKKTAETYFESLRQKDFFSIPFTDDIQFRAPLAPGGPHNPIKGKQMAHDLWWKPLEPALDGIVIKIVDYYYNESLTELVTKADITLPVAGITLRVADRFIINEDGQITEQENHFDASPLKSYIHHICLRSMDFERTKSFYQGVLGFPLAIEMPDLIIFVAGSVFIAFKKANPRNEEYTTFSPFEVGLDHIAIACEKEEDLSQFTNRLDNAGVENTGIKIDPALQKKYVAFKDPDRIQWEFYMR